MVRDMNDGMPENLQHMVCVAEALFDRFSTTQSPIDLFSAILACNHLPDWSYSEAGREFRRNDIKPFANRYPEWDIIRQIANGLKHCKKKRPDLNYREPVWKDADFWTSFNGNKPVWFVELEGEERAVVSTCYRFLKNFKRSIDAGELTA